MTATRCQAGGVAAALLMLVAAVPAARTQGPAREPADPMAALAARNIFDPQRSPRMPERGPAPPVAPPPRVRTLVLTGSLVYPGKTVAFFSGSEADYNRVVRPGETVGPWTVRRITTSEAELVRDDVAMGLPVGRQLTQREEEPWVLADTAASRPAPVSPVQSLPAPSEGISPPAAAGEGGMSDVMRRLLERRQKELLR